MSDPRLATFITDGEKVLSNLKSEYSKLQTGRANAALIEHIMIDAYGQKQDLRSLCGISVDQRSLVIQPWDRGILAAVEKALQLADLGGSPVNDGIVIRVTLPSMTEERRKHLQKVVHQLAEESRVALRKHRQVAHDAIKPEKDEDVKETLNEQLQKSVDDYNGKIAELAKKKEEEVMKV
ncbi:ribosome recycling factor [Candidatus Peribacteria bacterium]|nr:ribosome recycling factor [Candidatus Peribacteria bacterium]